MGDWSFNAGYFAVTGSTDARLYPQAPVSGSRTGDPATRGEVAELTLNRWLNSRLALQYTRYDQFNGAPSSYDVASGGRNAGDNNSLLLYLWIAY